MSKYDEYILNWMLEHSHTVQELASELISYIKEDPEYYEGMTPMEIYNEWLLDGGFCGEIWACKEEWEDNEIKCEV